MNAYVGLTFDILLLAGLGVAIFFALRLSRQFQDLQVNKKAFEQLIQSLNLAAARAEAAIRSLKETAVGSGDALQEKINKGRAMADELDIMVQAGDNLAERLNVLAEKTRKAHTATPSEPDTISSAATAPRSRAEKELLDALKAKQTS